MALLDSQSFMYDGQDSNAYDLLIGWFGGAESDTESGLSVDLQRGEFNMVRSEPNQYGAIPTDTLRFEFAVIHKNGKNFTYDESRAINRWLRGSNTYKVLRFNGEAPETINYYAVCTNIVDVVVGGHAGKKLTFVCNSPFGYTNKYYQKIQVSADSPKTINIFNLSDNGIYYPTVTIQTAESYTDSIVFENSTDENAATIMMENVPIYNSKKTVVIDGKKTRITDAEGTIIPAYKIGWDDVDNIYWIRLLPEKNTLIISGECTVSMNMEFPRKVGTV